MSKPAAPSNPPAAVAPPPLMLGLRRRTVVLFALLAAALAAFAATGSLRKRMWDRLWAHRLDVEWARQLQESELAQREIRARLRTELRKLVEDPENFAALMGAASAYGQLRSYDEALFLLDQAERVKPATPEVYRARGEIYLATGKYDRCIEAVEKGLALDPEHLELNLMRVDVDAILGWSSEARPRIQRLLAKYGGKEARVHVMAALLARQVADAKSAQDQLRRALQLDPKNDKIHGILSGLESELGNREGALHHVREAIRLDPNNPEHYLHLGEIQRNSANGRKEMLREAERSFRRALELSPGNSQARFGLAVCRIGLGSPDGKAMLEALVRNRPNLPAPLLELGNLYMREGRRQEGAKLLERYQAGMDENDRLKGLSLRMAMQPRDAATYREMGELHLQTGNPEKAIVFLRRALRLKPADARSRGLLRAAVLQAGRSGELGQLLASP